jgi:hypothetical protein
VCCRTLEACESEDREALVVVSTQQSYLKACDHRHCINKSLLIKLFFCTPRPNQGRSIKEIPGKSQLC